MTRVPVSSFWGFLRRFFGKATSLPEKGAALQADAHLLCCRYAIINPASPRQGNLLLEFSGLAGKVFLNHKSNLEGYRVVKLTKVKTRELSYLFKTVYEGVTVYKELS